MISLNEMESGETDPEQFHVKYDFLGNSFTCPLIRKHNRVHSMNETIVISFRSSLEQLQEYFEKIFVIPVEVFSKDTLIGSVQIRVQNHLKITNLKEFLEVYGEKDRTAQFEGSFKIQAITEVQSQLNHPFLKYNFSLKYVSTKPLYQPEVREVSKISSKSIEHEKSMKSNKSCESVKDIDLIDLGASGDNKEGFEIPQKEKFEVTPEIRAVVSETLLQANKLVTGKKNFKSDPNIATSTSINPSTTDVVL